jgi:hypothetical protein
VILDDMRIWLVAARSQNVVPSNAADGVGRGGVVEWWSGSGEEMVGKLPRRLRGGGGWAVTKTRCWSTFVPFH